MQYSATHSGTRNQTQPRIIVTRHTQPCVTEPQPCALRPGCQLGCQLSLPPNNADLSKDQHWKHRGAQQTSCFCDMPRIPQSLPFSSLPGPVTASASIVPNVISPIPLQQLSPSSTVISEASSLPNKFSHPWKFDGYKAFSTWMASEDDFFIIRRFQNLNARTILWMQDRIVQIEDRIKEIDKEVEDAEMSKQLRNNSLRWDKHNMPERHVLMGELSSLLHHYSEASSCLYVVPRLTLNVG